MLEKLPSILGEALKGVGPGLEKTVAVKEFGDVPETIAVESSAFGHGGPLPVDASDDGAKVSPPLTWRNVPPGTAEIALIVEDADSPSIEPLVHALAFGLPGGDGGLAQGALRRDGGAGAGVRLGKNSFMKAAYLPPDPPSGHGPHRYVFQVFALDQPVSLGAAPGRGAVVEALKGHVLAKGVLIGTYERT